MADPPADGPHKVQVMNTEEKRSDVNLACNLLADALVGRIDTAVILSNDSDLAEAIRLARRFAGIRVGVINPYPARDRSRELSIEADFVRQFKGEHRASSQFAPQLQDTTGAIANPLGW
ncbi:MAG: NYN domain-containing protein [Actinomycetes bacterium]